jgi:hypothetical protein
MLTIDQLRSLAQSRGETRDEPADGSVWDEFATRRRSALIALGQPSDDDVVSSALPLLSDPDRNLRVVGLRILGWYADRTDVAGAIVQASRDPGRRVRRIALQLLRADRPDGARRLVEIAQDPQEHHRIRTEAVVKLARRGQNEETLSALRSLLERRTDRGRVLVALLSQPVNDSARDLLERIVEVGTKEEAVAATRALCGFRLVRSDSGPPPSGVPVDISWAFTPGSMMKTNYSKYYWVPDRALGG